MSTPLPILHFVKNRLLLFFLSLCACKTTSRANLNSINDSEAVLECLKASSPEQLRDREVLFRKTGQKNCLEFAAFLPNLEYLNLDNTGLYSTVLLQSAISLRNLSARNNYIQDTKGLGKLKSLRELNLDNNHIIDISDLEELSNLEQLYLSHNRINSISPIAKLKHLIILTLNHNHISDFSALKLNEELLVLEVKNNPIDPRTCNTAFQKIKVMCDLIRGSAKK